LGVIYTLWISFDMAKCLARTVLAINIDLAEFDFTPQELEKVRKLFQKLNFALSDAFSEICPAASVIAEIRSK
jgi:hypothetical protein